MRKYDGEISQKVEGFSETEKSIYKSINLSKIPQTIEFYTCTPTPCIVPYLCFGQIFYISCEMADFFFLLFKNFLLSSSFNFFIAFLVYASSIPTTLNSWYNRTQPHKTADVTIEAWHHDVGLRHAARP